MNSGEQINARMSSLRIESSEKPDMKKEENLISKHLIGEKKKCLSN